MEATNKNLVWQKLNKDHGMNLNDRQLNDIDDIYIKATKDNFFRLGIYRVINILFAFVLMLLFFLSDFNIYWDFVTLVTLLAWTVYNMIHAWNNLMDYKDTKPTKYIDYVRKSGME